MNNRSACLFHYADKEIITEFYKVNNTQIAVCVIQQNLTLKYIIICADVFLLCGFLHSCNFHISENFK